MTKLPSLFLSHGSPNFILYDSDTRDFWRDIGVKLPRPSAILIMSAHFTTAQPAFEKGATPGMIYDFGGFEPELYQMTYPAPGAPALAEKAAGLVQAAGLAPVLSDGRGYDHGTWVPLKVIYPDADIPVATLSTQPNLGGAHHIALGQALAPLRDEGVLIVGSGGATHNLRAFFGGEDTPDWARTFNEWLCERFRRHRSLGKGAGRLAQPPLAGTFPAAALRLRRGRARRERQAAAPRPRRPDQPRRLCV
jgi:4,5-DOPA dioxygenase extradiol